jgi:hypothetical protein
MSNPADHLNLRLANFSSNSYTDSTIDRFKTGECTWYCCGRANEKFPKVNLSKLLDSGANAGLWLSKIHPENSNGHVSTTTSGPVVDSIAVFSGHVIYIEAIRNNDIYYTECNYHKPLNDGNYTDDDGKLKVTNSWTDFCSSSQRGKCQGFIVIR